MPAYKPHIEALEATFLELFKQAPDTTVTITGSSAKHPVLSGDMDIDQVDQIHGFEALITSAHGDEWPIVVLTRASGEPRLIRESCARLLSLIKTHERKEKIRPVVAATYIGRRAALICKEMNVSYFDLSGNCHLSAGSILIDREVSKNKNIERRPLRSVFSPKSSRIARLLLENPEHGWQVQELAKAAQISIGLASKVKQKLLSLDLVIDTAAGLKVREPTELLIEWNRSYSYKDNKILSCYAPGGQYETEGCLHDYCYSNNINYALTLFSAANRIVPFVRGITLSAAYVDADLNRVASELGWKPVPSGANFILLRPIDEFILRGIHRDPANWTGQIVSDIQIYLDLANYKGRGQEAAEFLLERRIQPKWAAMDSKLT